MNDYWEFFFGYWNEQTPLQVVRVFWYFFILEIPRFLLFDFVVVNSYILNIKNRKFKRQKAQERLRAENPLISIIVPGKNEGEHIYKLVNSLNEQSYQNFELIIVDDGSDDNTPIIGKNLEELGKIDRFIRNDVRGGKASAANLALRYCKGKYVVHLDADTSFDRDAIEKILIPFYMDPEIGAVGGNIKVRNAEESLCATLQAIEYLSTISMGRIVSTELGVYRIISGAFGAFKTEALKRIGGWDIGPGLDGDITVKFRKMGYKVHFEPEAIALTNAPVKFRALSKQRLRWSKSIVRFRMRKHSDVYLPTANFDLMNLFSFIENIGFNVILDLLWWIYIFDILFNNIGLLALVIPLKIILYIISDLIQFTLIMVITERKSSEWKYYLYLPAMVFYNSYYLRWIRTSAYIKELIFKSSYNDPWNPAKTSVKAKQNKL
ncbi:MAG: hypothetical protein CL843_05150 [Crocinitomicaceae bacterium]|nr:hypothetical protein [Crocinitomicaceae bacterium]|tara:strand:+ start:12742 stop:14049 length:1308 start_codon:yes stop_codon:yes gene_type:complete